MKKSIASLLFSLSCLLLIATIPINAQRLCETIVRDALDSAGTNCDGLQGDVACYGYDAITPTFYTDDSPDALTSPGNAVDVASVFTLTGTAFDAESDEWGIGYLQLGDGSPMLEEGEALRIILMGDVMIENAVAPDSEGVTPFEYLYMTSGSPSDCPEAVNNVVIQTPKSNGISITINEVPVELGSTVVFGFGETDGDEVMYIAVLDGSAVTDPMTETESFVGLREVITVPVVGEEEILDPDTGEPLLDRNGNPLMRRFVDDQFSDAVPLTEDGEGFYNLGYYEIFTNLPDELLNYAVTLDAVEEPCLCEEDEEDVSKP